MIICYSTSPGNPSIRTQQGSPFITEFCEVVNENPDCSIYEEMMNMFVNYYNNNVKIQILSFKRL